ncbi:MAG TPA: hypothetical protein VIW80_23385 [Pyrinomonadaceae bacterium]
MDCKACRNEIEDRLREERPSEEARAHLESCERCRTFNHERSALRELVSSLGTVSAPGDFDWKLRARLAADQRGAYRRRFRQGFAPGLPAIGLAASFVLLVAAAVLFKQADMRPKPMPVEVASVPASSREGTPVSDSVKIPEVNNAAEVNGVDAVNTTKASAGSRLLRVARATQGRSSRVEPRAPELTATAANGAVHSNDFSSSAAPVVSLFSIPVRTPAQPLRVLLDEGRGTMRTVALQPVTFGSQKILERGAVANATADTGTEEIW